MHKLSEKNKIYYGMLNICLSIVLERWFIFLNHFRREAFPVLPISTENGTYTGIQLYSTYGVEKWNEVNALLNIREQLKAEDSSITFREIQAAIWVLRPHPAFDLDDIDINSLPNDMVRNGELLFDAQKLGEIVETAKTKAKSFTYGEETKFVVIAETPADVQTVITVVSKK